MSSATDVRDSLGVPETLDQKQSRLNRESFFVALGDIEARNVSKMAELQENYDDDIEISSDSDDDPNHPDLVRDAIRGDGADSLDGNVTTETEASSVDENLFPPPPYIQSKDQQVSDSEKKLNSGNSEGRNDADEAKQEFKKPLKPKLSAKERIKLFKMAGSALMREITPKNSARNSQASSMQVTPRGSAQTSPKEVFKPTVNIDRRNSNTRERINVTRSGNEPETIKISIPHNLPPLEVGKSEEPQIRRSSDPPNPIPISEGKGILETKSSRRRIDQKVLVGKDQNWSVMMPVWALNAWGVIRTRFDVGGIYKIPNTDPIYPRGRTEKIVFSQRFRSTSNNSRPKTTEALQRTVTRTTRLGTPTTRKALESSNGKMKNRGAWNSTGRIFAPTKSSRMRNKKPHSSNTCPKPSSTRERGRDKQKNRSPRSRSAKGTVKRLKSPRQTRKALRGTKNPKTKIVKMKPALRSPGKREGIAIVTGADSQAGSNIALLLAEKGMTVIAVGDTIEGLRLALTGKNIYEPAPLYPNEGDDISVYTDKSISPRSKDMDEKEKVASGIHSCNADISTEEGRYRLREILNIVMLTSGKSFRLLVHGLGCELPESTKKLTDSTVGNWNDITNRMLNTPMLLTQELGAVFGNDKTDDNRVVFFVRDYNPTVKVASKEGAYAVAKEGLKLLTKILRDELPKKKPAIHVGCICPVRLASKTQVDTKTMMKRGVKKVRRSVQPMLLATFVAWVCLDTEASYFSKNEAWDIRDQDHRKHWVPKVLSKNNAEK